MGWITTWQEQQPQTPYEWARFLATGMRSIGVLLFFFLGFWAFRGMWGAVVVVLLATAILLRITASFLGFLRRLTEGGVRAALSGRDFAPAFHPEDSAVSMDIARYATSNSITSAGVGTDISAFIGVGAGASIVRVATEDEGDDEALQRQLNRKAAENKIVEEICQYIQQNFSDPDLNVEKVCDVFHRSRSGIFTYFKEAKGCGMLTYISDTRLNEARRLLSTTERSVADICQATGFSNQTTFFRAFKKQADMTPGQYRAAFREDQARPEPQ